MEKKLLLKELSRYPIGTYADIIYRYALLQPKKEAFVYGSKRITFEEYNRRVNAVVHGLYSFGLKKGDGIGILSWNCLDVLDVFGAAMKGGFIASPFNPRLKKRELEYIIGYSGIKALFVGKELCDTVDELRPTLKQVKYFISIECERDGMVAHDELLSSSSTSEPECDIKEEDPFIIFYTSGTTGIPKGALYNHYKKLEEARTKVIHAGIQSEDKHVLLLPLFHIGGWSHFWAFFIVGATNVIPTERSFDPHSTLKLIEKERATDIHVVPTQLARLLEVEDLERYDLSSLKRIWYAASPMPYEILKRGIEKFGPIFAQGYGQSESGPDITILEKRYHEIGREEKAHNILRSCGKPCMWVQVRIVDDNGVDLEPYKVGEIIMRSKSVMMEYWKMPEETENTIVDGWLHTGDMGYYDEEGFIYIVDRKKDMIISGGENVYPREIEEVLYTHPSVFEACVIGVPDEKWVERVHALIVLKEGCSVTAQEIIDYCKAHLAGYKVPKSVEFVDSLPKNPQGKILKKEIKERYWKREGK